MKTSLSNFVLLLFWTVIPRDIERKTVGLSQLIGVLNLGHIVPTAIEIRELSDAGRAYVTNFDQASLNASDSSLTVV